VKANNQPEDAMQRDQQLIKKVRVAFLKYAKAKEAANKAHVAFHLALAQLTY
jgi:DNA-binding FadR family transcriptional regulator